MKSKYKLIKNEIVPLVLTWAKFNLRKFPWREEVTPYRIFIAEMLLKRTTATAVNNIYNDFILKYPSIPDLCDAEINDLEQILKKIGLQKSRTKMLLEASNFIYKNYNSLLPTNKKDLMNIPNIGPYIAGSILSIGYGIPDIMVDSNAIRFYSRVFGVTPDLKIINNIAEEVTPQKENKVYNLAILDIGGLICKYVNPKCTSCPVIKYCRYSILSEKRSRTRIVAVPYTYPSERIAKHSHIDPP